MPHQRWFWGVVVRIDEARDLLMDITAITASEAGENVRPQDSRTGHLTLFYAPLRSRRGAPDLVERIADAAARSPAFDVALSGFGEFSSPDRTVAWLGVTRGNDELYDLRARLCKCDQDTHRHGFVPHLTLAYGEDPAAYAGVRARVAAVAAATHHITTRVNAVWIAGFPQGGHPARDLRYVERVALNAATDSDFEH